MSLLQFEVTNFENFLEPAPGLADFSREEN